MASKQPKAPISAHPLFPAVVAVWFAALFGLGSGVLPNILFEKIVTVTGISTLIPAATPPLGATARILFSLSAAIAGAALGFVLARKVAASGGERTPSPMATLTPRPDPVPPMAEVKRRPISVEDLGDTKLDPYTDQAADPAPVTQFGTRRRSLALAEEERPSDFLQVAPLPGHEPLWTQQGLMPPPVQPSVPAPEEPLELTSFAEPEPAPVPEAAGGFTDPRVEPESIADRGLSGLRNPSPFAAPTATPPLFAAPLGDEGEEPVNVDAPSFTAPIPEQAVEQQTMQDNPPPFAPPAQAAPRPQPQSQPQSAPVPMQVFAAAAEIPKPVLPADPEADLETLGMVQLTERLGASLQKRLGRPKTAPTFVDGLKADLGIATGAPEEEAIEPGSAIFGQAAFEPVAPDAPPPPPVIPAALRPLPLDTFAEDEEDHIPSLSLPLGQFAPPAVEAEEEDEPAEELEEENYSSLLAMKHPFRTPVEFVRIEEPEPEEEAIEPAVVFPGSEPAAPAPTVTEINARPFDAPANAAPARGRPNPEETERALRSALATLQRMGGA